LILSHDVFNERSGTVIGVAMTSHEPRAGFPLTLESKASGLKKRSWVKVSQIRTLSVDRLGDLMNAPTKYVVSRTLEKPLWRDTTIIRENVIESVRALKNQPGGNIVTDGSSQLVHALLAHDLVDELHLLVYPLTLGSGKRVLPNGVHKTFDLKSATPYPSGVVGLHYARIR
jgi:dihydrofolate reductase